MAYLVKYNVGTDTEECESQEEVKDTIKDLFQQGYGSDDIILYELIPKDFEIKADTIVVEIT